MISYSPYLPNDYDFPEWIWIFSIGFQSQVSGWFVFPGQDLEAGESDV